LIAKGKIKAEDSKPRGTHNVLHNAENCFEHGSDTINGFSDNTEDIAYIALIVCILMEGTYGMLYAVKLGFLRHHQILEDAQ
jgi:hypothetical protein